jgi:6-methylsalicylate decarboxylase
MGLVDVHHHVVPAVYRAAINTATDGTVGGIPQPPWSEARMLEQMTELGIARAVVSVSAPALAPIAPEDRAPLARACNEDIAALRDRNPSMVGGFAVLPLPDVGAALAELAHALDVLHLDGVSLLTNYDGVYLGDATFEPLLAELDRRAAVAHVHPNLPPPMPAAQLLLPAPVLEFTFDTTRMIAEMILTETLQRYERLNLVLSHLGGTLPWVAWRLSLFDDFPSARNPGRPREPVLQQLRRLYYDLALSAHPAGLRMAADVVGADRLLFGSDIPFAPEKFINANRSALRTPVDGNDLVAVIQDNTERLFT